MAELFDDEEFKGLNEMQAAFAREYIKSGNATQSAIAAGYARESAHNTGSRLIREKAVCAYIKHLRKQAENAAVVDLREVQERMSAIIRGQHSDPAVDIKGNVHMIPVHSRELAKVIDVYSKIMGWQQDNIHLQSDSKIMFDPSWQDDQQAKPGKGKQSKADPGNDWRR